jgi:rsbT co-antagonist protein RsbR
MENEFIYIGKRIVEHKIQLARTLSGRITAYSSENFEKWQMPESEYMDIRSELMGLFGEALYKDEALVVERVQNWASKVADLSIQYGIPLTDCLQIISLFRPVIWEIFNEELEQKRISPLTVVRITEKVDNLIDIITKIVGEKHDKNSSKLMKIAYTALEELSVPVVPITQGLVVIPLVGSIDTQRAQLIMDVSLNESSRLNVENVVFDLSGVPILDTMVSDALFKIISALRLIGIEAIITGIHPSVAQTIANLGIDFADIKTYGSLQQALRELGFKKMDSTVKY